jgi:preprotein translocase subunit SecA
MLKGLLNKVVGDPNEKEIRKLQPLVEAINAREPEMERKTEADFRALTDHFRAQLAAGDSLDDLLVEAFAAAREVAKRTVDMRPFDVQLIGGIVLHRGMVAEMRTGEGKTLVATMPIYLNALLGQGVHLVTVNDYLARRDSLWMGPIYHTLGLTVGLLQSGSDQPSYLYDPGYQREPYPGLRPVPRKEAYAADVTYGTNHEFGFDYLRDNLALTLDRRVQRPLYYAIVDEVDNIFIDEARTPLIISGPSSEPVEEYSRFAAIARKLEPDVHYELNEKERTVFLTDEGLAVVEQETGIENIYDEANYRYVHYMQQALKAQVLFQEGRHYIRQRKHIVLVDEHTGRLMPDRRLSEGLHQAIEAKEGVPVQPRDVTSATITIQNYFRMYKKLAGMSGTALTEGEEFFKIYKIEVLAIPTNKPVIRADNPDVVYRSEEAKFRAVAREILGCHSRSQPVLVGTASVVMSERLSSRLSGERLQMAVLAPRIASALQDADLDRDERARLREILNGNLETMNSATWKRMMRDLGLDSNLLADDYLDWLGDYLELSDDRDAMRALEHALRDGISHEVLNAKEHTREATIIARAGEPGAVTIATNMAGRGVDIKLGGELSDEVIHRAHLALRARGIDPFRATSAQMDSGIAEVTPQYAKRRDQVLAAGGLHVLGTERHEARRIDNQLRGRSGRQGEPGSSRFYLSLEDDLMRRFGRREMLSKLMETIGDDFPIEHNLVSKTIERAQTSVEGYNFDIRKNLLEYDDVLNRQRETIYDERLRILQSDDLRPEVQRMVERQVDEYLEKAADNPEQQRVLFAGLDDVLPLILPAPKAAFQGPLAFGSSAFTAYPPFTISFLAGQLAGQPLADAQQVLRDLPRLAAAAYGEQVRQTVGEIVRDTLDKYAERLDRYRSLLDEKIEDYLQLAEERNQPADPRRLVQHLERTFPLHLSTPPELQTADLDDMRDHWLAEVETAFHRGTVMGLLSRVQIRLPADVSLDRVRAAQIPADKLRDELRRVHELAVKQATDDAARRQLAQVSPPAEASPGEVQRFVSTVKETSNLDFGRLDRLVSHLLGADLDDLLRRYQEAAGPDETRLQRDLERLRAGVNEDKRGGRSDLLGVLADLNNLVFVELDDLEHVLELALAHEYDKWAQRQIAELEAEVSRSPLADTTWNCLAEHLLATHYTQRQAYDREHRRQTAWMSRLPFPHLGQVYVADMDIDEMRREILASLHWAIELRERTWGQQEFRRWAHLSLAEMDDDTKDGLLRHLGEQALGADRDRRIDDLSPDLYDHLRFTLKLRDLEDQRLSELPYAQELLAYLGDELEARLLDTPVGNLDPGLQQRVRDQLRSAGFLDDPQARDRLSQQPIRDWEPRTQDQVAGFWGRQFVEAHPAQPIVDLEPEARDTAIAYLQNQRRFVDEGQVQHFLVRQRLGDLPPEIQFTALDTLARTRLDEQSRRKIANLDVNTRQVVTDSLQAQGLLTNQARRDELLARRLTELEPEVQCGFGALLARQQLGEHRSLADLDGTLREQVVSHLKQAEALADARRLEELPHQRLAEIDPELAAQVQADLVAQRRAELAAKTMEELPPATRDEVHRALDEQNYFVDPERVSWYERKTLAQLAPDVMKGLELHLGHARLEEWGDTPFRDLPAETQQTLESAFASAGVLAERAERLRLTQTGSLADLGDKDRRRVAQQLGRHWLVQIRDRRPPDLPQGVRNLVWVYLRGQGQFADEFKEELFQFQRLEEFDAETQQAVEQTVVERLVRRLEAQPIGELPPPVQAAVQAHLQQADYFVDEARLQRAIATPLGDLPAGLQDAVETALGGHLLAKLDQAPVGELAPNVREALWRYLDQVGYFVDEKKRGQLMDHRLVDLSSEQYEQVVADLAAHLEAEIGDRPISDLDDDLRQGLRQAVEAQGFFESEAVRERLLGQPLVSLRRTDLEALSLEIGRARLRRLADRSLADLPAEEREAVLAQLQAAGWFVDPSRLDRLQTQRLGDLEAGTRQQALQGLRQQHLEQIRGRRLSRLGWEQRRAVQRFLLERGVALDEGQMRAFRNQTLRDLDAEVYHALLRDLGSQAVAGWEQTHFQDLGAEQQEMVSAYLGRRIMARIERRVLLYTISRLWVDYLTDIEDLRLGIRLEAYGQRDPLVEYKRRAFELFEELGDNIRRTVVRSLFRQLPEPLAAL